MRRDGGGIAMDFRNTQHGAVTVISLQGDLMGVPEAAELNNRVHKLLETGKTSLVVDLSGVGFINSSGLGGLILSGSTLKKAGGRMVIAGASKKVLELINVTKLSPVLETLADVRQAVDSLSK